MRNPSFLGPALAPAFVPSLLLAGLSAQALQPGAPAPTFALTQMVRGEAVPKLRPGVVHLIEFWGEQAGSGFDRHVDFARLKKQHGDRLQLLGVVGPSEDYDFEAVANYYAENGAHLDITIGFDGDGALRDAWLTASGEDAPVVFLVDEKGRLAWLGGFGMLPIALPKVLSGEFDPKALAADTEAAGKQVMKLALTASLKPEGAVAVLDELVAKWPALESMAVLLAWGGIVSGEAPEHAVPLQQRVYRALLATEDAWVMNGLAWSIVDPDVEMATRDLDLALQAAEKAVAWSEAKNPSILDTLARVYFWKKDYKQAVQWQQKAVALVEDEEERAALQATLAEYERLLAGG